MLPYVHEDPARTHGPPHVARPTKYRVRCPPEIAVVVANPTRHPVIDIGDVSPLDAQFLDKLDEWLNAFMKIARFCRPVIHLDVNVHGVIRRPWWTKQIIPNALQIRRLPAWTRTRDEQVSPVLEIQGGQLGII